MKHYDAFIRDDYQNIDSFKITDKEEYRAFISGSINAILSRQLRIKADLEL